MAINVALTANGGTASGTNLGSGAGTPLDITWTNNGGSPLYDGVDTDSWVATTPDNLVITFSGTKTIDKVVLWFNDQTGASSDPGDSDTASNGYQASNFTIATWNGASYDVQATITSNTLLKRTVTFAAVATTKVRFAWTTDGGATAIALQELQAFQTEAASFSASGSGSFAPVCQPASGVVSFAGTGAVAATSTPGPTVFQHAGAGTLAAVGAVVRKGAATFLGLAAFEPLWIIPRSRNWINPAVIDATPVYPNATPSRVMETSEFLDVRWASFGTDVPELSDGNHAGTPWVADGTTYLEAAIAGTTKLVDQIVIWSTLDPSNQVGHPTFIEPGEDGLIGDASGNLRIEVYGSGGNTMWYGDGFGGDYIYSLDISNNRATKLVVTLPSPMNVGGVKIMGGTVGAPASLRAGTLVQEVELLHTYTAYESTEISSADASSEALRVTKQSYVSTADATATAVTKKTANLESSANATAVDTSKAKITEIQVSSAAETDEVIGIRTAVLMSTADVAATALTFRPITVESSAVASSLLAVKVVHTETSGADAEAETTPGRTVVQTEQSEADATTTVIGTRRVIVTEVSAGIVADSNAAHAMVQLTLLSEAAALSTLISRATMHATEVSSAVAHAVVRLPASSIPVFWTNPKTMAAAIWEGLPFNSLAELDGVAYGADVTGIQKLVAKADDLDAAIESEVAWDLASFSSSKKKRLRSTYIDAVADGPFRFRVIGEQGGFDYQTHLASAQITTNHRAPLGRGWNSVYYRFGLLQDRYYSVSGIIVEMGDTTGRI